MSALLGTTSLARAVPITVNGFFTSDHCTGGCLQGQGFAGTISVLDNGLGTGGAVGTLTFNIQLANGNLFVGSGFDASFGFNLIGNPIIAYSGITFSGQPGTTFVVAPSPVGSGVSPPNQAAGVLSMDGTGDFEYGLDVHPNGLSGNAGNFLTFSISAPNLDYTDLAEKNNQNQFMAIDIYSGTTGNTGAIDLSVAPTPGQQCVNCTSTPEPSSLLVLGTVLSAAGLFGYGKSRKR